MTWNTAYQHIVLCSSLFTAILGVKTFYLFQLEVHFLCFSFSGTAGRVRYYSKSVNVASFYISKLHLHFFTKRSASGPFVLEVNFAVSAFFQTLHIVAVFDLEFFFIYFFSVEKFEAIKP